MNHKQESSSQFRTVDMTGGISSAVDVDEDSPGRRPSSYRWVKEDSVPDERPNLGRKHPSFRRPRASQVDTSPARSPRPGRKQQASFRRPRDDGLDEEEEETSRPSSGRKPASLRRPRDDKLDPEEAYIDTSRPSSGRKPASFRRSRKESLPVYEPSIDSSDSGTDSLSKDDEERGMFCAICRIYCAMFLCCIVVIAGIATGGYFLFRKPADKGYVQPDYCEEVSGASPQNYYDYQCDLLFSLSGETNTYLSSFSTELPEGKVLNWMKEQDKGYSLFTTSPEQILERYVMALLYYYTVSTNFLI